MAWKGIRMRDAWSGTAGTEGAKRAENVGRPALILEGGSFRSEFTAGVLDVMLERGIEVPACFGVSAGVLCALSFKSRQIGRANRVNLAFCDDPRYISTRSLATTGSMIGYDFMLNEVQDRIDPFDTRAFNENPMRLIATVTNMTFGTAEYLEVHDASLDIDIVRASTSLPLVTQPVEIAGSKYVDGGVADSVPIEHVLDDEGFDRAIVVLTQDRSYKKGPYPPEFMAAARARYTAYPYLLDALETRHDRYNAQREHIWEAERAGKALVIAPSRPVEVGHVECSAPKLLELYIEGRQEAERHLDEIAAFLG